MLKTIKLHYIRNKRAPEVSGIQRGNLALIVHPESRPDWPIYQIIHAPTGALVALFKNPSCCVKAFSELEKLNIPNDPATITSELESQVRKIILHWYDKESPLPEL